MTPPDRGPSPAARRRREEDAGRRVRGRLRVLPLAVALVLLAATLLAGLVVGAAGLPVTGILEALADKLPFVHVDSGFSVVDENVLFQLRVPRVLMAALVGGMLSMAGAGYQGVFRNPLADPYLLGAAAGAGVGATLMIVLVPGDPVAPFPPHTDFGFGHGLAERNVWLALTDARGDAALGVLPLAESLGWMTRSGQTHGVLVDCMDIPDREVRAGEALLFTPLHIHRARAPAPGSCRVSVDVRLVPRPAAVDDLSFLPLRGDP